MSRQLLQSSNISWCGIKIMAHRILKVSSLRQLKCEYV